MKTDRRHRPARAHARRGRRTEPLEPLAADRVALPARGPRRRPPRAAPPGALHDAHGAHRARHPRASRPRPRCGRTSSRSTTRGTSRRSTTALHDFARSYPFDPDAEDYLVHITTGTHVAQICLFLLTESRHFPARLVQTSPRPRGNGSRAASASSTSTSRGTTASPRASPRSSAQGASILKSGIETRNAAFNRLIDRIEHVALRSPAPILLHRPDRRRQVPARAADLRAQEARAAWWAARSCEVNCATLRGDGAMSALFGHVKGAFTGATHERPGLLRAANGGVLFLDEIGELGLDEQAMLLRAIEEKRFLPVGSDREVASDFQLHRRHQPRPRRHGARGPFREDLLARIDLWTFRLPALARAPRGHRAEPRLRARARGARRRACAARSTTRRASASCASRPRGERGLDAELPRPRRRRHAHGTDADGGRMTTAIVDDEIARLRATWRDGDARLARSLRCSARTRDARLDLFDRLQLEAVLAAVARCRTPVGGRTPALRALARAPHAAPTTPTGCASTSPASASPGTESARRPRAVDQVSAPARASPPAPARPGSRGASRGLRSASP